MTMTPNNPSLPVTHDTALRRFEVLADGVLAFLSYTREGAAVVMDHTYVPDAFRGRGVGAALVRAALDEARRQNWSIVPRCSFVAAFIERNPEYADLVDHHVGHLCGRAQLRPLAPQPGMSQPVARSH
jgi:predicted GNAT family acetyltransferase